MRAKASGSRSCDGARPSRTAITTTTGKSAATEPLTLISAVSPATSSIIRTTTRARGCPRRRDQLLSRPGRHARRVERLADDEERGDEDDRRVAEAGERLLEVEDARRPERQATPSATIATGRRSQMKTRRSRPG